MRGFSALMLAVILLASGCATGGGGGKSSADRFDKAFTLMQDGKFEAAERELLRLGKATPADAQVWLNLGIVQAQTDRLEAARESLLRARKITDRSSALLNELGIVERRLGNFAAAAEAYRAALALDDGFAKAHYNLGVLLDLYLRDPVQALTHYEAYVALEEQQDRQVEAWIKDLQRRVGAKPAARSAAAVGVSP